MSEYTYIEQYIARAHILPHNLNDRLMEALKEVKDQKNAGRLKRVHELIDHVENKGKKLPLYEKVFLELMVVPE